MVRIEPESRRAKLAVYATSFTFLLPLLIIEAVNYTDSGFRDKCNSEYRVAMALIIPQLALIPGACIIPQIVACSIDEYNRRRRDGGHYHYADWALCIDAAFIVWLIFATCAQAWVAYGLYLIHGDTCVNSGQYPDLRIRIKNDIIAHSIMGGIWPAVIMGLLCVTLVMIALLSIITNFGGYIYSRYKAWRTLRAGDLIEGETMP